MSLSIVVGFAAHLQMFVLVQHLCAYLCKKTNRYLWALREVILSSGQSIILFIGKTLQFYDWIGSVHLSLAKHRCFCSMRRPQWPSSYFANDCFRQKQSVLWMISVWLKENRRIWEWPVVYSNAGKLLTCDASEVGRKKTDNNTKHNTFHLSE